MEEKVMGILEQILNRLDKIEENQDTIWSDVKCIKGQQQEHGQILKALEHAAQVNKAEHDNMQHAI